MKPTRAFTLIELLVVIAVIAVLMGILMPALQKAKEQGQTAVCQGNLKGYSLAVAMYAQDNDDKFSNSDNCYFYTSDQLPGETAGSFLHRRWCNGEVNLKRRPQLAGEFFKYLADVKGLICPTFKKLAMNKDQVISGSTADGDLVQFDNDIATGVSFYEPWHNYTQNAYLGPPKSGTNNSVCQKTMQVKDPATVFVFADEGPYTQSGYNRQGLNDTRLWVIYATDESRAAVKQYGTKWNVKPGPDSFGEMCDMVAGFHYAPSGNVIAGKGNCSFADGHVAPVSRDESFCYAWPK
jgi:prepilin-type N-terminal cleavage/methylation domain-containing protein/prepilin-type processing-associated H-X9-DG protein